MSFDFDDYRHMFTPNMLDAYRRLQAQVDILTEEGVQYPMEDLFRPQYQNFLNSTHERPKMFDYLQSLGLDITKRFYAYGLVEKDKGCQIYESIFENKYCWQMILAWAQSGNDHLVEKLREMLTDRETTRELIEALQPTSREKTILAKERNSQGASKNDYTTSKNVPTSKTTAANKGKRPLPAPGAAGSTVVSTEKIKSSAAPTKLATSFDTYKFPSVPVLSEQQAEPKKREKMELAKERNIQNDSTNHSSPNSKNIPASDKTATKAKRTWSAPKAPRSTVPSIEKSKPQKRIQGPIVGIDFGTTYSVISVWRHNNVEVVPAEGNQKSTPSYVSFQGEDIIVGDLARDRASKYPTCTVFHLKRMVGRKYDYQHLQAMRNLWPFQVVDHHGDIQVKVGNGKSYTPGELITKILEALKQNVEEHIGQDVSSVIATIPAHFNREQRKIMKEAFAAAGLEVIMFVTEPTAAALAYSALNDCDFSKYFLVFDLGGGTFDLALLESKTGLVNVLAIDGDPNLGGEDFDNAMMEYCIEQFQQQHKMDLYKSRNAPKILIRLRRYCEREKRVLSTAKNANVYLDSIAGELDMDVPFTADLFNGLIHKYLVRCMHIVDRLLSQFQDKEISQVILVGGSSKIPKVQDMLREKFGGRVEPKCFNPEEAVARGAAIMGSIIKNAETSQILIKELGQLVI